MKISIIVPVYNVEKYLARCINSILAQDFEKLEIILVDDGSTDNSGLICDEYSVKYTNIKVIHKENQGLGFARNSGLDVAQGKYIMFVDSDDYLESNSVKTLYTDLITNNADTCIGGCKRICNKKETIMKNPSIGTVYKGEEIKREVLSKMIGALPDGSDSLMMSVWRVLFSRDIIENNNLKFPSEREYISEDIIFDILYYCYAKKVVMSEDCGYCYCDNEGTLTTRYNPNRFDMHVKLYKKILELTRRIEIYEYCKCRMDNTFISNVRYCIKLEVKFKSENERTELKQKIKSICDNEVVSNVLAQYDNSTTPKLSRIVNWLIKRKYICGLILACKINLILRK